MEHLPIDLFFPERCPCRRCICPLPTHLISSEQISSHQTPFFFLLHLPPPTPTHSPTHTPPHFSHPSSLPSLLFPFTSYPSISSPLHSPHPPVPLVSLSSALASFLH